MLTSHHIWMPYTQMKTSMPPLKVRRTEGCVITLEDGSQLIDGTSSWWTACHGYCPPAILEAMRSQSERLCHVMLGGLVHEPALQLSQKLCQMLPGLAHVFYSESGSVAVEVALKMCLQYWKIQGVPNRNKFIHFKHGYHGDTFYAMSVCCPEEGMHRLFGESLPQQYLSCLPTGDWSNFENFLTTHQESIAGLIIEPLIQGAGGMKCHSPQTLNAITQLTQSYDIPVIFDEIFTGFGRTGTMFALDQIDATPDIVTLGKALTGGVTPLAATVASPKIFGQFWSESDADALMHGPTYMGHALGCQAALASIELFETHPRLQQVAAIENHLKAVLLPIEDKRVKQTRVKGAMGVIEFHQPFDSAHLNKLKSFFIKRGVWIRPFANIIYIAPAFTISMDQLSQLTQAMIEAITVQVK